MQQLIEDTEPVHKVTIIPRGVAYLGATMSLPEKDSYTQGRQKLLGELAVCMGGRVAEELIFGDVTNGAASDIKHATDIARLMVCNWGMSDEIGPQRFGENQELMFLGREVSRQHDFSQETARRIDSEVERLLREAQTQALESVTVHRDKLELIAERLLDLETIDGRDVVEIVEEGRILSPEEREVIDKQKEAEEEAKNPTVKPPPIPEAETPEAGTAEGTEAEESHSTDDEQKIEP